MEITFRAKNVALTDDDKSQIAQKLDHLDHLVDGVARAEVSVREEKNPRISEKELCEVTLHTRFAVVRAKSAGFGVMAATDKVIEKLEHRIEKTKGKLIGRSHPHHRLPKAPEVVLDADGIDEVALLGGAQIVKSKSFAIPSMVPAEAALQMQLLSHDFYFFTNHETGLPAIVYQRDDGDVGLINVNGD